MSTPAAWVKDAALLSRIGRFEVRKKLGQGGFGTVYRAFDPQLERDVAVKVPKTEFLASPKSVERFLREAKAAARLNHPHIVPVYDAGRDGELNYIASAFIDGQPLAALIEPLAGDFRRIATLVQQLAEALDYAHSQGVIHRDVKPDNVMIDSAGQPHLMDFGLARIGDAAQKLTHDGTVMGTPAYMSPEQACDDPSAVTHASDQYSLGVVLYELLTGEVPFSGPPAIIIFNVLNQPIPAPRSLRADLPPDLETICLKALSRESSARYATCADLAADLERWLNDEPIQARRTTALERGLRWCKRNPILAGLATTVVVTFVVGFSLTYWQWRRAASSADEAQTANTKLQDQQQNLVDAKNTAVQAAEKERLAADKERQATESFRRQAYYAEINQVQHALDGGDVDLATNLLEQNIPQNGETDLRDFEWHYLWRQCHLSTTLTTRDPRDPSGRKAARALAFSPDGRQLVASEHNLLHVWDVATKQRLKSLKGHAQEVWSVVWHPDGTRLIAGGGSAKTPGELFVWDVNSGQSEALPIQPEDIPDITQDVTSLALSRDGGSLFVATARMAEGGATPFSRYYHFDPNPGSVLVWDLGTRKVRHSFRRDRGGAMSVAVSPDGRWLACGGTDGRIAVWDTASPDQPAVILAVHKQYVWNLRFSKDGRQLFSAAGNYMTGGELLWWDVPTWTLRQSLDGHQKCVFALDVDPTGRWLCSGGYDRLLRIWDIKAQPSGNYADWQGKWRYTGTGYGHGFTPSAVSFAPDGQSLASADWYGNVRLWNIDHLRSTTDSEDDSLFGRSGNKFAKNSVAEKKAAERGLSRVSVAGEGAKFQIVRLHSDRPEVLHTATLPGATRRLGSAVSSDQTTIAITTWNNDLLAYDVETGKNVANIKLPTLAWRVAFAGHGRWLVVSGDDGRLRRFNTKTWALGREYIGHTDVIWGLAVNPPATRLASVSWDGTIRVWDATTGVQLLSLPHYGGYDARFSADNTTLSTGGGVYQAVLPAEQDARSAVAIERATPPEPVPGKSYDRPFAEWFLKQATGELNLVVDGGFKRLKAGQALPKDWRFVQAVTFAGDDNRVFGDESLETLSSLPNLAVITLGKQRFSVRAATLIAQVPALEVLNLDRTEFPPDAFTELAKARSLRQLGITGQVDDQFVSHWAGLSNLQYVRLSSTLISDTTLKALGNLTRLTDLQIDNCKVDGHGFVTWTPNPRITNLSIFQTPLNDAGLRTIVEKMPGLVWLRLNDNSITDDGVSKLTQLKSLTRLELNERSVTDTSVPILEQLTTLQNLSLRDSKVTTDGVERLKRKLSKLTITQ